MMITLRANLTDQENTCANYILENLTALEYIKVIDDNQSFHYNSNDLMKQDTIQTVASLLDKINHFKDTSDVIYFYEKPYKWVDEANVALFVDNVRECVQLDATLDPKTKSHILWTIKDYADAQGFDIDERIASEKDDLKLYQ